MKRKLFILGGVGCLAGMAAVLLFPLLFNPGGEGASRLVSAALAERLGSPGLAVAVSLLVFGLYGACCMLGTALYRLEHWPLAKATAAHYLIVALGYAICGMLLEWNLPVGELLLLEGGMTVGFFLIWLFLYLRFKAEVRELNRLSKEKNNTIKKEETK